MEVPALSGVWWSWGGDGGLFFRIVFPFLGVAPRGFQWTVPVPQPPGAGGGGARPVSLLGSVPEQGAVPAPGFCRKMLGWVRLESPHGQTRDDINSPYFAFFESMQEKEIDWEC